MGRMDGRAGIITGGCGGAGLETCRLFAKEGASVVIADINEEVGRSLQDEICAAGGKALFVRTDVTSEDAVAACVDQCVEAFGKIDYLINIACIMTIDNGPIHEVTEEMFDKEIAFNLKGAFFFVKHAVPEMVKNGKGAVVNFSSIAASTGDLGHTFYGAAKAGVETMTRNIAAQYGKQGVRANCIRPGIMLNDTTLAHPGVKEFGDFVLTHLPGTRIGYGADAAPLALFFASDESEYITGQVLTLDGGLTCHQPQWKEDRQR
ncbi:SDR family NAD(P)-dependent oxidoreductase [Arabiibacter massiliensis]|uniref:SDR family NAD(P)-dependent oxidoreductase n=1 Tax=Arabiibacter massiliensis TaxID=1870985 RepID=UPI0009B9B6FC|nr:glucose 1-dehydrogenase [Arabiibacter massiliensis]